MKQEGEIWIEEDGTQVPVARVFPHEKWREKNATTAVKRAKELHEKIQAYKQYLSDLCEKAYHKFRAEHGEEDVELKTHTWYNFDHSIKIVMDVKNRYGFKEDVVELCHEKFIHFLESISGEGEVEMLKSLITGAFEKKSGKFDASKLDALFKHKDKTLNKDFHEALELLKDAKHSKEPIVYFRIFEKVPVMEDGKETTQSEYAAIDLNFSSINLIKTDSNG